MEERWWLVWLSNSEIRINYHSRSELHTKGIFTQTSWKDWCESSFRFCAPILQDLAGSLTLVSVKGKEKWCYAMNIGQRLFSWTNGEVLISADSYVISGKVWKISSWLIYILSWRTEIHQIDTHRYWMARRYAYWPLGVSGSPRESYSHDCRP